MKLDGERRQGEVNSHSLASCSKVSRDGEAKGKKVEMGDVRCKSEGGEVCSCRKASFPFRPPTYFCRLLPLPLPMGFLGAVGFTPTLRLLPRSSGCVGVPPDFPFRPLDKASSFLQSGYCSSEYVGIAGVRCRIFASSLSRSLSATLSITAALWASKACVNSSLLALWAASTSW